MRRVVLAHDADCWKTFDRKIDVATPAVLIAVIALSKTNGCDTRPSRCQYHVFDDRLNTQRYAMFEELIEQRVKALQSLLCDVFDPPSHYMPFKPTAVAFERAIDAVAIPKTLES